MWTPLFGVFALLVIWSAASGAVPQSATGQGTAQQSSKSPSPFAEAEALYQQGSNEEAKRKIEEQLRQNPKSVEGYNLLGIIYTSEKNYARALDAFQQALTVDPKSARTRNNIGNIYVAQQNLVLA
jgi:cytochrome c-type biogenesis protein CcmH/NrfG